MKTVVVAMDKFKGTATAAQAGAAICAGINQQASGWRCSSIPLADGGDGTVAALCRAGWDQEEVQTLDAQGRSVVAVVARREGTVVIELADICGIARWQGDLRPWDAHTIGLGRAIGEMIDRGCTHVIVALGGSASTDGGLGVLTGLGFQALDSSGSPVASGLAGLRSVRTVEPPSTIQSMRNVQWTVLVDVDAPLYGPRGAAYAFGPQKGVSEIELGEADLLLRRWDEVLAGACGRYVGAKPGTGAAGGVAAALVAMFGARLMSGFDFVADQVGLATAIENADAVVTGEGRVDASSMSGKAPGEVIRWASRIGVPVFVVAGDIDLELDGLGVASAVALMDLAGDAGLAMRETERWLREAGRRLGTWLDALPQERVGP